MKKFTCIGLIAAGISLVAATAWAGGATFQGFDVVNVIVNGKTLQSDVPAVSFYGRTMLPVRAVAEVAGMDVAWDEATNTATLTSRTSAVDTRAMAAENEQLKSDLSRVKQDLQTTRSELASTKIELTTTKAQLAQAQADLQKAKSAAGTTVNPSVPSTGVTKDNLVSSLQKQFGSLTVGDQTLKVTWYTFTSATGDQYVMAETDTAGRIAFLRIVLDGHRESVRSWFEKATQLIATVYPTKAVSGLVVRDAFSSYPNTDWDDVKLGDDLKWHVTEYILWYDSQNGVTWDTNN